VPDEVAEKWIEVGWAEPASERKATKRST